MKYYVTVRMEFETTRENWLVDDASSSNDEIERRIQKWVEENDIEDMIAFCDLFEVKNVEVEF